MTDTLTDAPAEPIVADEDFLTIDVCNRMAVVLAKAAAASPLRGYRAAWLAEVDEWQRAASDLQTAQQLADDAYVMFAGAVMPGQHVYFGERGFLRFTRIAQGGSLQLEDINDPRPCYLAVRSPQSPVLVRKEARW